MENGSAHPHYIDLQKRSEFFEFSRDMSDTNGAMVCRSMLIPALNEVARTNGKTIAAIRIPYLKNRPGFGIALSHEQLKAAPFALDHREQRNWTYLDTHFYRKPLPYLTVIDR